jgi:superfamily II DNA/RNA helicase
LRDFKRGTVDALVATDVAARGIHVDGVDCVVHYDPPDDHKAYLHRSGRTARAGAGGHVVSMVLQNQARASRRLQKELGLASELREPTVAAFHEDGGDTLGRPSPGGGTTSHPARKQDSSKGSRNAAGGNRHTKRHTGDKATKKRSSGGKASTRKGKGASRSTSRDPQSGNQGRGGAQRTRDGGSTRRSTPRRNSSGASRKRRSR